MEIAALALSAIRFRTLIESASAIGVFPLRRSLDGSLFFIRAGVAMDPPPSVRPTGSPFYVRTVGPSRRRRQAASDSASPDRLMSLFRRMRRGGGERRRGLPAGGQRERWTGAPFRSECGVRTAHCGVESRREGARERRQRLVEREERGIENESKRESWLALAGRKKKTENGGAYTGSRNITMS